MPLGEKTLPTRRTIQASLPPDLEEIYADENSSSDRIHLGGRFLTLTSRERTPTVLEQPSRARPYRRF